MRKITDKRKNPRIAKRLAIKFYVDHKIFMGMSGNLSEHGLFIKTNRDFAVDSPVDIELLLPGKQTAFLKGIIKRTPKTDLSSIKNGIAIQISENDKAFMDFVTANMCKGEAVSRDDQAIQKTGTPCNLDKSAGDKSIKNTFDDNRLYRRFSVGKMKVTTKIASANQAVIINMGKGGMLVKSDKRLHVGQTYTMKIGYKGRELLVNASVMWALLVESIEDTYGNRISLYMTGMQFIDDLEKIEDLVRLIASDAQAGMIQLNSVRRKPSEFIGIPERDIASDKEEIDRSSQNACKKISKDTEGKSLEVIVKNKQSARKYFENGKLAFWNGNFRQAELLFGNAVNLHNTCARYFAYYAKTLLKLGKLEDAESAIRKALEHDAKNSEYFIDAGDIYHAMGLSGKAGENYETALRLQPSNIKAHKAIFKLKKMIENGNFLNKNPLRTFKKMVAE